MYELIVKLSNWLSGREGVITLTSQLYILSVSIKWLFNSI